MFMSVPGLLMRIKNSFGHDAKETEADIMSRASDHDLLVLDDLGAEKTTDWTQQTIYTLIDIRSREGKDTIITSNLTLGELAERMGDRIASRVGGMCKVISMGGNDRRLERDFKSQAAGAD